MEKFKESTNKAIEITFPLKPFKIALKNCLNKNCTLCAQVRSRKKFLQHCIAINLNSCGKE